MKLREGSLTALASSMTPDTVAMLMLLITVSGGGTVDTGDMVPHWPLSGRRQTTETWTCVMCSVERAVLCTPTCYSSLLMYTDTACGHTELLQVLVQL